MCEEMCAEGRGRERCWQRAHTHTQTTRKQHTTTHNTPPKINTHPNKALANELLPSTKGHGMGWGWAVFTFGFAFLPPLLAFQLISAKLNPAMCLAQAIWG